MGKIKFGSGFQMIPEGVQELMVTAVEVNPRDGEPRAVNVKCVNRDGIAWSNKYQLPRGQRALYVLVTKGLGFKPSDIADGFDPTDMVGHAFRAEIVHRESEQGNVFANLGNIEGPCKPWGAYGEDTGASDEDDDDWD